MMWTGVSMWDAGDVTFDDGEIAGLERDDIHRVLQPGSSHLLKYTTGDR